MCETAPRAAHVRGAVLATLRFARDSAINPHEDGAAPLRACGLHSSPCSFARCTHTRSTLITLSRTPILYLASRITRANQVGNPAEGWHVSRAELRETLGELHAH